MIWRRKMQELIGRVVRHDVGRWFTLDGGPDRVFVPEGMIDEAFRFTGEEWVVR